MVFDDLPCASALVKSLASKPTKSKPFHSQSDLRGEAKFLSLSMDKDVSIDAAKALDSKCEGLRDPRLACSHNLCSGDELGHLPGSCPDRRSQAVIGFGSSVSAMGDEPRVLSSLKNSAVVWYSVPSLQTFVAA